MAKKTFILSDETINSYGFQLSTAKLHLDRFKTNPVMLYNHHELVGKWENIRIENDKLLADTVFMEDAEEVLSAKVSKRVEGGFVNGASLGINIIDVEWFGDIPVIEAEVIECSVVDVPSNKNAVVLMNKDGEILEEQELKLSLEKFEKSKPINKMKLSAANLVTLGLDANATEEQINAAVVKLAATIATLKGENTNLKKGMDEITQKAEADRKLSVKATLDTAFKLGKFPAEERADYEELADTSMAVFEKTIANLTATKKLPVELGGKVGGGEDRSNWTAEDYRKKDTAAFLKMKAENPQEFNRLVAADK